MPSNNRLNKKINTFVVHEMGSSNSKRIPSAEPINESITLLGRDYKGWGNWGSNGIIEIIKVDSMYENNTMFRAEQSRAEQSRAEQLDCCIRLGNAYNDDKFTGGNFGGNVWMKTGASASQQCVVEIKKMGNSEVIGKMLETSNQRYQVYDKDLLCPTLQAAMGTGGGNCPYFVDEKQIVAMRGRNPENPSDRTAGIHLEQRLEPNSENMCNTLTSVQKDNLVLETLDVQGMRMVRTEEGKRLRKQYETGEIKHGFNEFREPEMKTDGISNTISTVLKDTEICETKTIKIKQATKDGFVECEIPGIADLNYVSSTTRRGRVQENGKMCPTLCAENVPSLIELGDPDFYNFLYCIDGQIYLIRIRKLIPLECWRLMGFTDEDFHKAEKVNSNTQLYKQAGNSIVKNCLMAIYKQML